MKKVLLSMAAVMVAFSASAQPFDNGDTGYTESFGASGTSCLKNFANAGYQFADGNVLSASNNANEITITAKALGDMGAGVAAGTFDFYFTDALDNCSPMRTANIGVDLSPAGSEKLLVRAKASVDGATIQFHVASAPNSYPTATTASIAVPVAQTQKVLTTTYTEYLIDYSGAEWDGTTNTFQQKINMWGVIIPSDNALNDGAVFNIEVIKIGDQAVTGNTSAEVVNDQVTLFPNPAKGAFNLDMTAMNNSEAAIVKVMNANGMIVKEFTTSDANAAVTTEGMNKGIYLVQITAGNKVATKKVVVE